MSASDGHGALRQAIGARRQRPDRGTRVDTQGVRPIGHWFEDGWAYCALEAPASAAVCLQDSARGLACETVRPIDGLRGTRPIPVDDQERVRGVIEAYWPPAQV
jgi:hypothetical protein